MCKWWKSVECIENTSQLSEHSVTSPVGQPDQEPEIESRQVSNAIKESPTMHDP